MTRACPAGSPVPWRGDLTINQSGSASGATLPLAIFGPAGYGLRTGILAAPARVALAAAPFVFGVLLD